MRLQAACLVGRVQAAEEGREAEVGPCVDGLRDDGHPHNTSGAADHIGLHSKFIDLLGVFLVLPWHHRDLAPK